MRVSILILVSLFYLTACEIKTPENEETQKLNLNKEELCELLQYDVDGAADFLRQKGYKEKQLTEYPGYYLFSENKYAVFPVGEMATIAISTDWEREYYFIVFTENHRKSYLEFLEQFPEIKSPFPKIKDYEEKDTILAAISPNCSIRADGFMRDVNGYVLVIMGEQ